MTPDELQKLQRELADTKVLSVYLDTGATDPAMREAWRPALHNAIREARTHIEDEGERAEFDRAAEFLREPEPSPGGTWGSHGWVAFAAADGPRYVGDLPVTPGTHATWRNGPVVSPYLRALKQLRPVLVALVESGSARLFRYAVGKLESIEELTAPGIDTERSGRPSIPSIQGTSAPAPRGTTGSDAVSRRRRDAFERLTTSLGERLQQLGHGDSWILIGGTREWAMLAGDALGRQFAQRMLVSTTLAHDASETEISDAAKHAASELRATQGLMLVDQLVEQGGAHARAAVGIPATQRALRENAVDTLLVTPKFIGSHEREVEDFVRASMAIGADVEVPSGKAAEQLDKIADGIAARLRFPIDELPDIPEGDEARA
ncbi:MAG: hypothetical protein ABI026_02135 [Gemmatimonadaceae bacterium]